MSDALPDLRLPLTDDERLRAACDWSDYRKEYGVSADPAVRAQEHTAFLAGWTARHQETQSAYKDETIAALALATVSSESRADRTAASIAAVRDLHRAVDCEPSETVCHECSTKRGADETLVYTAFVEWPCATIEALDEVDG